MVHVVKKALKKKPNNKHMSTILNQEPNQRRKMNILYLVLALLFALIACSVGKKCTYTQDGTKLSSYLWLYNGDKQIDLDKNNSNKYARIRKHINQYANQKSNKHFGSSCKRCMD